MTSLFASLPLTWERVISEYSFSLSGSRDATWPSVQWVYPPHPPIHKFRFSMWHLNTKTGKWTDERQVFWGLFLHCRWLIRCCGRTWQISHVARTGAGMFHGFPRMWLWHASAALTWPAVGLHGRSTGLKYFLSGCFVDYPGYGVTVMVVFYTFWTSWRDLVLRWRHPSVFNGFQYISAWDNCGAAWGIVLKHYIIKKEIAMKTHS